VYGHFRAPITKGKFATSGQSVRGTDAPQSGFFACLPLQNLRQNAAQAERAEDSIIVPFPCRAMAICWNVVGQTEGTGTITARVKNATSGNFLSGVVDIDALSNDVGRTDALTGIALVNRDISRGDVLELHVASGAGDVVPIGALSGNVWVWVQGHIDFTGVGTADQADQGVTLAASTIGRSGGVSGPAEGGSVFLPFYNKRASNATIRTEDMHFLPVPLYIVAISTSRQSSNAVTRQLFVSGTVVNPASATQNYIAHNEGNNFPAPGSWTGGVITTNSNLGDDLAVRNAAVISTLQFAETGAGDAAFNTSMHVLCAVRGQFYTDPAND
jgi:hypothetical protein